MKKRMPLLIISALPPSNCPAARAAVQTALALARSFDVTIVVSDTAPPFDIFSTNADIEIIRLRHLQTNPNTYRDHRRLYILGDTYQSLFALELYLQAPGIVWAPNGSINQLIQDFHASKTGWPRNYAEWLIQQLGTEGETIAHGLLHHRRLSKSLMRELPLVENSDIICPDDAFVPANLTSLPPVHPSVRPNCRTELSLAADDILVLSTEAGATRETADTLTKLHDLNTVPGSKPDSLPDSLSGELHFKFITGAEENMSALVAAADILLVTSSATGCPMPLAAGLAQNKAMIVSAGPWSSGLPADSCIRLPHADALHQMVAAVAALSRSANLRNWYSQNVRETASAGMVQEISDQLDKRLREKQQPLSLPDKATVVATAETEPFSSGTGGSKPLSSGPARSVALIGAVPPRPLLNRFFPEVNWDISPRFATPALAAILCADMPSHTANKLALLGYDSPMISNSNTPHVGQPKTLPWSTVQQDLKATTEALCFGCNVEGAISADALIANQNGTGYRLTLSFQESDPPKMLEATKILAHFEENCGLFWRLDPVRHKVDCMLVAGLTGRYQVNMETHSHTLLVADALHSAALSKDNPVILAATNQGVLSFSLSALDSKTLAPLSYDILTKILAHCGLNLEWLDHG